MTNCTMRYGSFKFGLPGNRLQTHTHTHTHTAVNRDRSEDPELSLAQGVDDLRTQVSLQEAFDQATAKPPPPTQDKDEWELEPEVPSNRGGGPEIGVVSSHVTDQSPAQSGEQATAPHPHEGTFSTCKQLHVHTCTGQC